MLAHLKKHIWQILHILQVTNYLQYFLSQVRDWKVFCWTSIEIFCFSIGTSFLLLANDQQSFVFIMTCWLLKGLDHTGHNCSSSEIWFSPTQGFNHNIPYTINHKLQKSFTISHFHFSPSKSFNHNMPQSKKIHTFTPSLFPTKGFNHNMPRSAKSFTLLLSLSSNTRFQP